MKKDRLNMASPTIVEKELRIKVVDHEGSGVKFRKIRKGYGLSLTNVAEIAEISPAYLSDLELGRRNWKPELWSKLMYIVMNGKD